MNRTAEKCVEEEKIGPEWHTCASFMSITGAKVKVILESAMLSPPVGLRIFFFFFVCIHLWEHRHCSRLGCISRCIIHSSSASHSFVTVGFALPLCLRFGIELKLVPCSAELCTFFCYKWNRLAWAIARITCVMWARAGIVIMKAPRDVPVTTLTWCLFPSRFSHLFSFSRMIERLKHNSAWTRSKAMRTKTSTYSFRVMNADRKTGQWSLVACAVSY